MLMSYIIQCYIISDPSILHIVEYHRSSLVFSLSKQTAFNKTYTEKLDATRRTAWEENLIEIYKHNLMAAMGHHSYTLRDNHIADLSTRQYIREMVSKQS